MALLTILIITALTGALHALSTGPPSAACITMRPGTQVGESGEEGHTTSPQNILPTYGNSKEPPYYIMISPHSYEYNLDSQYQLYIIANQTTGHNFFKGLILQARRVVCASNNTVGVEDEPIGTFSVGSNAVSLLQTLECTHADSTLGHYSPWYKINETATWHSPDGYQGHIVFFATVVQTTTIYWTDVHSSILMDPNEPAPPRCTGCYIGASVYLVAIGLFILRISRHYGL